MAFKKIGDAVRIWRMMCVPSTSCGRLWHGDGFMVMTYDFTFRKVLFVLEKRKKVSERAKTEKHIQTKLAHIEYTKIWRKGEIAKRRGNNGKF